MVVIDTDIIIDHLRQKAKSETLLMKIAKEKPKDILAISMVSLQELYEGKSTEDEKREQYLLATISPLKILPYTYEVAKLAGEIARDLPRPIELADAAIAATTIIHTCQLATLNKKHFVGISNLELF